MGAREHMHKKQEQMHNSVSRQKTVLEFHLHHQQTTCRKPKSAVRPRHDGSSLSRWEGTRNRTAHAPTAIISALGLRTRWSSQMSNVAPEVSVWKSSHSDTPNTNCAMPCHPSEARGEERWAGKRER